QPTSPVLPPCTSQSMLRLFLRQRVPSSPTIVGTRYPHKGRTELRGQTTAALIDRFVHSLRDEHNVVALITRSWLVWPDLTRGELKGLVLILLADHVQEFTARNRLIRRPVADLYRPRRPMLAQRVRESLDNVALRLR